MTDPSGAEPAGYRIFRWLARFLAALFYRRVEVANHHQGLMDGILLTAARPRRLRSIAKAPLFRYPVIGQIARLAGAIPVHRRQDGGGSAADNQAMFVRAHLLARRRAIMAEFQGLLRLVPEPVLEKTAR